MPSGRPKNISHYAEECLKAIADKNLGHKLSLGGAFGLLHYLDYRSTNDVDAWWAEAVSADKQQALVDTIESVLQKHGTVRKRSWGEVVSIELLLEGKKTFSFQVAERTAQLETSKPALWTDVLLDSLSDLLASKMVALVERGAPRDFRDVHAVCHADLATPRQCWDLWRQRQELSNSDTDFARARLAIETHLVRIERQRPLRDIQDADQRVQAEQLRAWYKQEFLYAELD